MKLTKTKLNRLLILTLAFHISSLEASHDDEVRILIVGTRGQSRFSAADLLSGRKDSGQQDREIIKTPVITDEGRRMMLVTGPNLCEEDTARQIFTTALFLSSPGLHAVLMVLNLEDQHSNQCDIVKQAQELLGAEVLQYCIVLLVKNHQEHLTGASREMINACGGRFHIISDSEPKPAERAALIAEIDKLVWLNGDRFYAALDETQQLESESLELMKRLQEIEKIFQEQGNEKIKEENPLLSVIYNGLGIVGWILLSAIAIYTELNSGVKFAALGMFMFDLRNVLHPDFSIPLNLALVSSLAIILNHKRDPRGINGLGYTSINDPRMIIGYIIALVIVMIIQHFIEIMHLPFMLGSAMIFGTIVSIRTWSDVLIACYAASGVTIGTFALTLYKSRESPVFALEAFLCCSVGATLSVGFVNVLFALLGVKMTIILLILGFATACLCLKKETLQNVTYWIFIIVVLPCVCVFIGSVFLILGSVISFLKVIIENGFSSYLLYVALLLGSLKVICQRQPPSD